MEQNVDRIVARIARSQHGLLTREHAVGAGVTEEAIRQRLVAGRWEPAQPHVYRIGGSRQTWRQELLAACMAANAVASHQAACQLWGLRLPERDVVEVTVRRGRMPRLWGGALVHRSRDLHTEHITLRDGIPVTKPARTLVDLGAVCGPGVVDRAVDDLVASKLTTLDGLRYILDEVGRQGRRGVGTLRRCLDWRYGDHDSSLEARVLRIIATTGSPTRRCSTTCGWKARTASSTSPTPAT